MILLYQLYYYTRSSFCIFVVINVTFLGSYEEDLLGTASWEINGPNRRNSFEDKQGTPIKVRKSPNSRKPAPTKPQSLRRVINYLNLKFCWMRRVNDHLLSKK